MLKEYAAKFPHGGNPVTEAFEAVAAQQQQQQLQVEKEAAKGLANIATGSSALENASNNATNGVAATASKDERSPDQKRLKDLEKTVNALVARLQHVSPQ